jgi:hypothetical protein
MVITTSSSTPSVEAEHVLDEPKEDGGWDLYSAQLQSASVFDSLFVLGQSFQSQAGWPRTTVDFMKAYITNSAITRNALPPRNAKEDIYSNNFLAFHATSNRSATQPRDYIFTTMPQFPWYHDTTEAEQMTFSEIFLDFHRQSVEANHPFSCRITLSMIMPTDSLSSGQAWFPSHTQLEPTCSGDFLKLLGQRLPPDNDVDNYHFTTAILVADPMGISMPQTIQMIQVSMEVSARIWAESRRGGELGKHGCQPADQPMIQRVLELLNSADQTEQSCRKGLRQLKFLSYELSEKVNFKRSKDGEIKTTG